MAEIEIRNTVSTDLARLAALDSAACARLVRSVLDLDRPAAVEQALEAFDRPAGDAPLRVEASGERGGEKLKIAGSYSGRVYVTIDRLGTMAVVNAVPENRLLAGLIPAEIFPSTSTRVRWFRRCLPPPDANCAGRTR